MPTSSELKRTLKGYLARQGYTIHQGWGNGYRKIPREKFIDEVFATGSFRKLDAHPNTTGDK